MLSLHKARNTKNASFTNRSSVGIGRPKASRLPSLSSIGTLLCPPLARSPDIVSGAVGKLGSGMSRASPFGTGIEIGADGRRGGEEDDPKGEGSVSATGAGAVGIESLGLGSAKVSLLAVGAVLLI